MNVLQVLPALEAGGVERTTIEISEALSAAGHKSHVASAGGRMENALAKAGGVLHKLDVGRKNPMSWPGIRRQLTALIRNNKIDIVHARSRAPAWPARAAARHTGTAFVTTYHGIYNARSDMKRRYNAVMADGDIIIANSEFTKNHIIKEHGTPADKITVIPRGVDMKLFDPALIAKPSVEKLRSEWNIDQADYVVLLPGRLTRWKGQEIAIKALNRLPKKTVLILLGDAQGRDKYVDGLWQLAREIGVDARLRIPGHSDEVATAYAAADCVISASTDPEAFGRVLAEAQAMGRPVIGTAHGGAMETVLEHETGLLVPPGEPVALADAVQSVQNWTAFDAKKARARIAKQFSKAQLQEKTLATYSQLLL